MGISSLGGGGGWSYRWWREVFRDEFGNVEIGFTASLNPTNPRNTHQIHHPFTVSYVPRDPHHHKQPLPAAMKYTYPAKPKLKQSNLSDDEKQGITADSDNCDGKK